jgi:ABC-type multidrug transport system ATPase subunit
VASSPTLSPTLEVSRARVDVEGRAAIDGLSFVTSGERVLVLGAGRALFEAASGTRAVAHGTIRVSGTLPLAASRTGAAASAPLDPRLPPKWSVRTYAFWSARLTGRGQGEARSLAEGALEALKLSHAAGVELGKADLAVRRATVVAAALATSAPTLLLEDPTANLPDAQARALGRAIVQATEGRRTLLFAGRVNLASPLSTDADEAVVVSGSDCVAQGAPAELVARERTLALRIHGDSEEFARVARERGAHVTGAGGLLQVDLGENMKVKDLLAVASETEAVVIEVIPIARAFA